MIQGAWLTTEGDIMCMDTGDADTPYRALRRKVSVDPSGRVYCIIAVLVSGAGEVNDSGVFECRNISDLRFRDAYTSGPSKPAPRSVTEWVKKNIKTLCNNNAAHLEKWSHWMEG